MYLLRCVLASKVTCEKREHISKTLEELIKLTFSHMC